MKKVLRREEDLYHYRNGEKCKDANTNMTGNCTDLWGNCTDLQGDCSDL